MEIDPPFREAYKDLIPGDKKQLTTTTQQQQLPLLPGHDDIIEECELPLVDLRMLLLGDSSERERCRTQMARASEEWGFFQLVNHGVSREILDRMRREQVKVFRQPFELKKEEDKYLKFPAGTYRWGTPSATCLKQLAWSEAFHVPMTDIASSFDGGHVGSASSFDSLSSAIEQFATTVADLAQQLAGILAENLGRKSSFFKENCVPSTCYLRMNRYPPCPFPAEVFGLMPHTDSDFLTILHQDQVGGLQLVKDGRWFAVKPNPQALIINIGDLFQAWSNGAYKSVEHRVVTNPHVERFSTAYFFCPWYDTEIESECVPSIYRKFSFKEYRQQVQDDVQKLGHKVGLARFVVNAS